MKKIALVLCLGLMVFSVAATTLAVNNCEPGWCCACSRRLAECVPVAANQYGGTQCAVECPGPIHQDCMGVPPAPGSGVASWRYLTPEELAVISHQETDEVGYMSIDGPIVDCQGGGASSLPAP